MSKGSRTFQNVQRQHVHRSPRRTTILRRNDAATLRRAVAAPDMAAPQGLLALQETYGNRAVNDLLAETMAADGSTAVQPKLTVGPSRDRYEREADQIADQVVEAAPESAQRQVASPATQVTPYARQDPGTDDSFTASAEVEDRLQAARGRGEPLPRPVRADMEARFGADLGRVRVHADGEAAQLSRELRARAFTHGTDIYFGAGRYSPTTTDGRRLLAHELTHVLQQGGGVESATVARVSEDEEKRDESTTEKESKPDDLSEKEWQEIKAQGVGKEEWEKLNEDDRKAIKGAVGDAKRLKETIDDVRERPNDLSVGEWREIRAGGMNKESWGRLTDPAKKEIKSKVGNTPELLDAMRIALSQPSDLTFADWKEIYDAGVDPSEWRDPAQFDANDKKAVKDNLGDKAKLSAVVRDIRERPTHGTTKGPDLTVEQWQAVKALGVNLDVWNGFTDESRNKIKGATGGNLAEAVVQAFIEQSSTAGKSRVEKGLGVTSEIVEHATTVAGTVGDISGTVSAFSKQGSSTQSRAGTVSDIAGITGGGLSFIGGAVGMASSIARYRRVRGMRGVAGRRLAARARRSAGWGAAEGAMSMLGGAVGITSGALSLAGKSQASGVFGAVGGGLGIASGLMGSIRSGMALKRSVGRRSAAKKYFDSANPDVSEAARFVAKNQGIATRGVSLARGLLDIVGGAASLAGSVGGSQKSSSLISTVTGGLSSALGLAQKKMGGDTSKAATHAEKLIALFVARNPQAADFAKEVLGISQKSDDDLLDELQQMATENAAALKQLLIEKMAKGG